MSAEPGSALQDLLRAGKDFWWVVLAPAVPSLWVAYREFRLWRTTDRKDRLTSQEQREARDQARETARLEGISAQEVAARALLDGAFQRQREELAEKATRIRELEAEIAALEVRANALWHAAQSARQAVWDLQRAGGPVGGAFTDFGPLP